jgi:hypothetical protein
VDEATRKSTRNLFVHFSSHIVAEYKMYKLITFILAVFISLSSSSVEEDGATFHLWKAKQDEITLSSSFHFKARKPTSLDQIGFSIITIQMEVTEIFSK